MDRVFSPIARPCDDIDVIAIAVCNGGNHIGILYHEDDDSTIRLLHLGWHLHLSSDEPKGDNLPNLWIKLAIHDARALQIEAFLRLVWTKNRTNGIPYAFSRPSGVFGTDGALLSGSSRIGLTCATFVLAVFDSAKLPLVQYDTWVQREDDTNWENRMVNLMRRRAVPEGHVNAVRGEIPAIRYRPLEVAGAGAHTEYPVAFATAIEFALRIEELLKA